MKKILPAILLLLLSFSNVQVKAQGTTCLATFGKFPNATNYLKYQFEANLNDTSYRYFWTFGDNGVSDARAPFHIYASAGKYNVCLRVTKKDSTCTQMVCDSITIVAPYTCNANWTKQNDPVNALKVYFNAAQGGNTIDTNYRYFWTFGDNGVSDNKAPNHIYAAPGKYKVCLKVTKKDSSCTQTICDSIQVGSSAPSPCNAAWTKQADAVNSLKIYFTSNSGGGLLDTSFRYYWTFGDNGVSDSKSPNHTYAAAGKYKVCLKVTKKDSSCTQTICDSILVGSNTPTPCNANWIKQTDAVNVLKIYFTSTSGNGTNDTSFRYFWTFGDNGVSDNKAPNHIYAAAGKYKVCLKVTKKDSSCTQTICDSIVVGSNTSAPCNANWSKQVDPINSKKLYFTSAQGAGMIDTNYRYYWTFGDNGVSDGKNPTHTYANNGKYKVCLRITKKDSSCTQTICDSIVVGSNTSNPCNANFNIFISDSAGANPHYVRFANTSTGTTTRCIYTFGDGTSSDNCNPIHNFVTLGSKTVCLSIYNIVNGDTLCRSTTCKTFNNSPVGSLSCIAGFSYERIGNTNNFRFINHSTGSPLAYKWTFDGSGMVTSTNAEHLFSSPGLHTVCLSVKNLTDTNCQSMFCVSILTTGLSTQSSCIAEFVKQSLPGDPYTYAFTSLAGSNFANSWNFGDGTYGDMENTTHTYMQNGKYFVCLSVVNLTDSCSDMRCDSIHVSSANGINESNLNLSSVYPVPVTQVLSIDLQSKIHTDAGIRLYDITGHLLIEENHSLQSGLNQFGLDMQALPQGIYLLQIQSGEEQILRKIIK